MDSQINTDRKYPLKSSKVLKPHRTLEDMFSSQQKAAKKKHISSLPFVFPKVEIYLLDLIHVHQDLKTKYLTISLQPYFKFFFHQAIEHNNQELNQIVMKFLSHLKSSGIIQAQIVREKWPPEFWQVKNTEELLILMREYNKGSSYWFKYILVLIASYCIPSQTVRKSEL